MDLHSIDTPLRGVMAPRLLPALFALLLAAGAPHATAASVTGTTTGSVNVRSGPGTSFPTVTWLLSGTSVTIEGCLPDWLWCDVVAGRNRGWVYSRYLSHRSGDSTVMIRTGGASLGLPQTTFSLGAYWDAHYQDKIWFSRKAYWQQRWDRRTAAAASGERK